MEEDAQKKGKPADNFEAAYSAIPLIPITYVKDASEGHVSEIRASDKKTDSNNKPMEKTEPSIGAYSENSGLHASLNNHPLYATPEQNKIPGEERYTIWDIVYAVKRFLAKKNSDKLPNRTKNYAMATAIAIPLVLFMFLIGKNPPSDSTGYAISSLPLTIADYNILLSAVVICAFIVFSYERIRKTLYGSLGKM